MQMLRVVLFLLVIFFGFTLQALAATNYKYSYVPKKVYENQLFPITIIGIGEDNKKIPTFTFETDSKIKTLSSEPLVIHNGSDSFYTFYFKAKKHDLRLPSLVINTMSTRTTLPYRNIFIHELKKREDFCQVLAADFKIKNSQVSNYDEKNHIVTLSIEAIEANLEDISLSNIIESGIEGLKRKFAKVTADFYVIVPMETKVLKFTYFNTIKKQYVFKEIPIVLEDASVAAQSQLNPKEDSFQKLKKYVLMTLSAFFLLMFILKKDFFYLVFAAISIITLLTLYIPHKKICISQGASLYILPTSTSTVSTRINKKLDTLLLGERKGYKKVEYKEGIIGWIKNEDICKN